MTSLAVIVAFALLGEQVLQYLKISMPALQGAGGLLLLLVALQLLTGAEQFQHAEVDDVSVALVPLGTPLHSEHPVIVATIILARQSSFCAEVGRIGGCRVGSTCDDLLGDAVLRCHRTVGGRRWNHRLYFRGDQRVNAVSATEKTRKHKKTETTSAIDYREGRRQHPFNQQPKMPAVSLRTR